MVSIHRPLGYGPSTLPLRHAALYGEVTENRYSLKGKPIISKGDEFNNMIINMNFYLSAEWRSGSVLGP